jgi:hypothetical protein
MNVVCAWCGTPLVGSPEAPSALEEVSHGICGRCADVLLGRTGTPLQRYLDELGVPVFLVSDEVRMVGANEAADTFFPRHGAGAGLAGRLPGEVFECANAAAPGGCGRTIHCSGCVLRATITETYRTGTAHFRVPASLEVGPPESRGRVDFLITTTRLEDKVALRIDPVDPVDAETLASPESLSLPENPESAVG